MVKKNRKTKKNKTKRNDNKSKKGGFKNQNIMYTTRRVSSSKRKQRNKIWSNKENKKFDCIYCI